jgi:ariadne-2
LAACFEAFSIVCFHLFKAREALKKYLHYYERWENHSKSLQLEQQTLDRMKQRINEKVMEGLGTWIDWQYLFDAATLLAKCRYTLQYTYPYAYFMEAGSRKDLFEYQQVRKKKSFWFVD